MTEIGTNTTERKYPRMSATFVVAARRRGPDGSASAPLLGRTRSVGLGGFLFECGEPLEPGVMLDVELVIGERTIAAAARVVYREPGRDEPWGVGVQFVDLAEDDRDFLLGCYLQQEYRISPG